MNLNEYQRFTRSTATYNEDVVLNSADGHVHLPELYPALALAEETGEVLGKYAKFVRKFGSDADSHGSLLALKNGVIDELGDVLYNISEIATHLNIPLQQVLDRNVEKLTDRKARNVIVGEGDNR